jgi:uncharacterized protein
MTRKWSAMNNRASSFHAEHASPKWYRQRWPWLLIAGPAIVVVASLTSAWLAVTTDDGLVASDYYKQGLLINRKLGLGSVPTLPEPGAIVAVSKDGRVQAHVNYQGAAPTRVWLKLSHPGEPAHMVVLAPSGNDVWVGTMAAQTPGRWIVSLESDLWRLPVTTVQGQLGVISMGAVRKPS